MRPAETPARTSPALPDAPNPAVGSGQVRRSRARGGDHHATWRLIGLALLGHMLRSRRFYERVAFTAIVLAALRGLGQENRAATLARLTAWNKRQVQLLERKAGREARRLERRAKGALTRSR